MPIARFEMPDGRIGRFEVPDGTTPEQASAMIKASISTPRSADALDNPNMATDGMSGFQQFASGMGKSAYDLARGLGQITGLTSQEDIDAAKGRDAALMKTAAGVAGNIAGNVAMAAPTMAIPGVNTLTGAGLLGAGMGAIQPVASDESRLTNTALGAAGGLGGQVAANAIGRAIRPIQSSLSPELSGLAAKAEAQGIHLDIAQKTGSRPLAIVNSVLDNLPFTADKQAANSAVQRGEFNRAVLKTVGENSDTAGPDVLNAARTRIGGQFNALSGRNSVTLGDDFVDALAKIESGTNAFTKPGVRDAVDKGLEIAASGKLDGMTYQKIRSTLTKQSSDAFKGSNSELGQALKTIRDALDDAAGGSISAADKTAWGEARKQWQALKAVEQAAAPTSADAVAGNISPAKLSQAVMRGNKQGMVYGTGDQTLPDLARIGQAFIKDQIPNSGTAQRQMYQNLLTGGGAGAGLAGLFMGAPPAALAALGATAMTPALVQKLMTSPAGQRYLSQGLLSGSPELIKQAGGLLGRAAPAAGAASLPYLLNAQ